MGWDSREQRDQIADAELAGREEVQDADPGGVGEPLKSPSDGEARRRENGLRVAVMRMAD